MASLNDKHFESLKKAFEKDNFVVKNFKEQFPGYRNPNDEKDWQTIPVHGSISLFELKAKTIRSLFGYYGDETITITLPNYLEK